MPFISTMYKSSINAIRFNKNIKLKAKSILFLLYISFILSACSSVSSLVGGRHKHDYAQNFETMTRYNFSPASTQLTANPDFIFIQSSGAQLAIENGMATKKLLKERHMTPDMWLNYYFTGEEEISVGELNKLFEYNLGLAWDDKYGTGKGIANSDYHFSKRTIIIDLVSKERNRLIWRGSAPTGITSDDSERNKREALDEAVKVILAPFPPQNNFESLKTPVFNE
ncbi:MAG: DUF4136 domain-containing protein [Gammaproteobacteria bacterium]|nr:DUF4136 domain-containing protein [Gammaproteobacteria bacterium]